MQVAESFNHICKQLKVGWVQDLLTGLTLDKLFKSAAIAILLDSDPQRSFIRVTEEPIDGFDDIGMPVGLASLEFELCVLIVVSHHVPLGNEDLSITLSRGLVILIETSLSDKMAEINLIQTLSTLH
jgi:hypothetical protein